MQWPGFVINLIVQVNSQLAYNLFGSTSHYVLEKPTDTGEDFGLISAPDSSRIERLRIVERCAAPTTASSIQYQNRPVNATFHRKVVKSIRYIYTLLNLYKSFYFYKLLHYVDLVICIRFFPIAI